MKAMKAMKVMKAMKTMKAMKAMKAMKPMKAMQKKTVGTFVLSSGRVLHGHWHDKGVVLTKQSTGTTVQHDWVFVPAHQGP